MCIWCEKSAPEVTFYTEPHILPHSLGGCEIGRDVCDECNHYFGNATKGVPSINLAFKEVFGCFRMFGNNLNENSYKRFRSAFFQYRHSEHKIKINNTFDSRAITKQFKRGLYEVFLQKYHADTGNGNHPMFDYARKYARYGIGTPHIYYAFNNIIFETEGDEHSILNMNKECIDDMMESGLYRFWFYGHIFYIEVLPVVYNAKGIGFLQKEASAFLLPAVGNEKIYEFKDVMEIDFFMQRFNS